MGKFLVRYPNGLITDWGGRLIDPAIRQWVGIGNTVRIPIGSEKGRSCTMYFRIIKQCKKKHWFVGVCEDPYYGQDPWFPYQNGDQCTFSIYHIMEIPLDGDWGNNNLIPKIKYRNKARSMTGSC